MKIMSKSRDKYKVSRKIKDVQHIIKVEIVVEVKSISFIPNHGSIGKPN